MSDETVDLRSRLGGIRDQKKRNTCLAFAASDTHAVVHGNPGPVLSADYAHYFACKKRPAFLPEEGTSLADMYSALEHDGQPLEKAWPYSEQLPMDLSTYVPPAVPVSELFKRAGEYLATFDEVTETIRNGTPVLLCLTLSLSFHFLTGSNLLDVDTHPQFGGYHAVIAVGFKKQGSKTNFTIRNSWGRKWADGGYGFVSETYLRPRTNLMGVFRV